MCGSNHSRGWIATELPRDLAPCAHTILDAERALVVADATLDERFHDNPLVTGEPHVRFYAGQPLLSPEGYALGTFGVLDRVPHSFSDEQRGALRDLAKMAEAELTTAELNHALHRLRAAEENYRGIFENVAEGIFQVNCEGQYLNANPSAARSTGTIRSRISSRRPRTSAGRSRCCPSGATSLLRLLRTEGRVTDFESEIYRRNGTPVWVSESIHAVKGRDGQCQYYEGTVHEHLLAALRRRRAGAGARRGAQDAQIKSDFLSMMSHEIARRCTESSA